MRRLFKGLLLALLPVILIVTPVLAYVYRASFVVTEDAGTSYDMLGVNQTANIQWMVDNGFISASGNDTAIETLSGLKKPHMLVDDRIMTAIPIPADSQTNLYFTTGNTPEENMEIISGYNGYITIPYDTDLYPGTANWSFEWSGWLDTDVGEEKDLKYQEGTILVAADNSSAETVNVWVADNSTAQQTSNNNDSAAIRTGGRTRYGQRLNSFPVSDIMSVSFLLKKSGNPTGIGVVKIRRVSDDAVVASVGSIDVSTLGAAYAWYSFSVNVTHNRVIRDLRFSFEYSGGDAGNYVLMGIDDTNPGAGVATEYTTGPWSDIAGSDACYKVKYSEFTKILTASGISSGEHTIKVCSENLTETFNPSLDGWVRHYQYGQVWATLVAGAGTEVDATSTTSIAPFWRGSTASWRQINRGIILFDTSSLPDSSPIQSATLQLYGVSKADPLGDTPDINVYSSNPASKTVLAAGDYDSTGTTPFATAITYGNWNISGYNTFTFNSVGLTSCNTTGYTQFSIRNANYDVADVSPSVPPASEETYLYYYNSEQGAGYEPTLTIKYTVTRLYIDGTLEDTSGLGTELYDSGRDILLDYNNVMPYMNYYKHYVGGTLIAWYQPNDIISGTTLPDRQGGDEDAVITFGGNPSGIAVTLGSLESTGQPVLGQTADRVSPDSMPAVNSDLTGDPTISRTAVTGSLLTHPARPFVTILSDTTTLNEVQAWRLLGIALVLLVTVAVGMKVREHLLITGIACGASLGFLVASDSSHVIFPLWIVWFIIAAVLAGVVSERSPSL